MVEQLQERIKDYTSKWESRCYPGGIPDKVPLSIIDKAPSWKKICICILKNDMYLTGLGYSGFTSKYYHELKRIELLARESSGGQIKIPFDRCI